VIRKRTFRPTVGLGAAGNSVTPDILQRVWSELDYRIDVCRVTRRGHIEYVRYHIKLYEFMQL
jgi:hypothetical protein